MMTIRQKFTFCSLSLTTALALGACGGSDADADKPASNLGGSAGSTAGGSAGSSQAGSSQAGSSQAGSAGSTSGGSAGAGGGSPVGCSTAAKPSEVLKGDVTASRTLTSDKDWILEGIVFVKSGATLTIDKCTTVKGQLGMPGGTLVVQPGGKLHAEGTRDEPIVFTSAAASPKGGDWGGVILLGNAPINVKDAGGASIKGKVEGITAGGEYGGSDPQDSSGVLKYVRIEYAGYEVSPNNEINGLTFAGVGAGTTVDFVQVRQSTDDCFEFFGGTVNAKHLICQYNGDDGIDWDFGFTGKLQFVVVQQDPSVAEETNGFEGDNDAQSSLNTPVSEPTIYNATLIGKNKDVAKQQYGMLLRRSTKAHLFNVITTGFEAGADLRDAKTSVELKSSIFFGNVTRNVAYAEDGSNMDTEKDDDAGTDDVAWFMGQGNLQSDPGIPGCFDPNAPEMRPAAALTAGAATPPSDGFFDTSAAYIGAFKDKSDDWATGAWVRWSDK